MIILIVSAVFQPEPVISAITSSDIADKLIHDGKQVIVITNFPNRPGGILYTGYHRKLYQLDTNTADYKILRCYSSLSPTSSLINRLLENITFGLSSSLAILFSKKPDVIYSNTWPVFAQGLTCLVAKLRRIPIVLSVQDIYPESLQVQGRLSRTNIIYKVLRWIDRMNARSAKAVIVISERFKNIYTKDRGIAEEKVHVIPNWTDTGEIKLLPKEQSRRTYNIPVNDLVLVYAGNVGAAAGVETIIQAMGKLPESSRIILLIAGEGSQLSNCKELAKQIGNEKIFFHSPWLREETGSLLSAADIFVLPTRGNQSLVSVPSKMITYLFSGKPILALAKEDSDIADIIKRTGCGWVIEPDRPENVAELVQKIKGVAQDEYDRMGAAGRKYALEHHSRETNVKQIITNLQNAITR